MALFRQQMPYKTVKSFFRFNAYSKDEYDSFVEILKKEPNHLKRKKGFAENKQCNREVEVVLLDMTEHICRLIGNVLQDSPTDPHYSAVAASNRIKCYIQIMTELGHELPYQTVPEFFQYYGYSQEQYDAFEKSRKEESVYYRGVQY